MKFNMKFILPYLLIFSNQIGKGKTQTDEQLNSFKYGAEEFRLAIIGDSGTEREALEVMQLSTFDALLHLGDFDYNCIADKYFTKILDSNRNYQFMGVIGNHDAKSQCPDEQADKFRDNVYNEMTGSKNNDISCKFSESKFMWVCIYKNMRIIGLTPGINGADKRKEQLEFLKQNLENAKEDWKVCAWHFYDKYYHTGKYQQYGNIVSEGCESFYDYCKDHGAIVFSAHDHVYARTRVMSKFLTPEIDQYDSKTEGDIAQIRNGATINILNGAGGFEMYVEQGEQKDYPHWQKKYALGDNKENEKKFGGLFCNFNVGGNSKKASCEFLRINSNEKVFDTFKIYQNDKPDTVPFSQIDEDFKNEKIKAFKSSNGIVDQTDNSSSSSNGTNSKQNGKASTSSKLLIGGILLVALTVAGAFVFVFKKNKKNDSIEDPEIVVKRQRSYKDNSMVNNSFTSLPRPTLFKDSINGNGNEYPFLFNVNVNPKLDLFNFDDSTMEDNSLLSKNKKQKDNYNYTKNDIQSSAKTDYQNNQHNNKYL